MYNIPVHKWYCSLLFHLCNRSIHIPEIWHLECLERQTNVNIYQLLELKMANNKLVEKILWTQKPGNNISSVEQTDRHILSRPVWILFNFWIFIFQHCREVLLLADKGDYQPNSTSLSCIFDALLGDTPLGHMSICPYLAKYGNMGSTFFRLFSAWQS